MDKKSYLLKLLSSLKEVRPLAEGFIVLIENDDLDDELLTILDQALQTAIQTTTDTLAKAKLQKGADFLEQMKKLEAEKKAEDDADLAKLDEILAQM
jgi:high-affinity Fe2+/Pb2+ permease